MKDTLFYLIRLVDATKQSGNNENLKQKSNSILIVATPSINATISGKQRLIEIIFIKETDNKLLPAKFDAMIDLE